MERLSAELAIETGEQDVARVDGGGGFRARPRRVSLVGADRCRKVAVGAMVYADYCANCHGEQLRNTTGGATFDLRRLRSTDRDRFFSVVLNGKSQMPPWRGVLQSHQIESIWAYIRATLDR